MLLPPASPILYERIEFTLLADVGDATQTASQVVGIPCANHEVVVGAHDLGQCSIVTHEDGDSGG